MSMPAVRAEGVVKRYPVFKGPVDAVRYLHRMVRDGASELRTDRDSVVALDGVSFSIAAGERVGLVGRNGAGKSTLLKLLAGGFQPNEGSLRVAGEVYSLLPGSVSFSLEQSVRENALNHLSLLPLTQAELARRLDEIREFAELDAYFDQPVRKLSLGMRVRAEFAVATARDAEVLVIDEVLGAGDIYWAEKIARRMEAVCARGTTLLLVSHALDQINRYCTRALWIERGRLVMDGPAQEVTKRYEGFLERLSWQTDDLDDKTISLESAVAELGNETLPDSGQTVTRWPGRGEVYITGVWLNGQAASRLDIEPGGSLDIRIAVRARVPGDYALRYLITFWDALGKRAAVMENDVDRTTLHNGEPHEVDVCCTAVALLRGRYSLTLSVIDAAQAQRTTTEAATRMDVIYKSFTIAFDSPRYASSTLLYRLESAEP